ncbi:MAG: S9 family peptidase [Vicinamibacterales bacterium]|nr:S9 family peptidase [Vicinamibacterales bacterium]
MKHILVGLGVALTLFGAGAARAQTIDELVSLKRAGAPAISPDGRRVAYTVREANWEENRYDTQIWIANADGGEPRRLTGGPKSSTQPAWSPDGRWIAFLSDRTDTRQLYRIAVAGGEAERLTSGEEGVNQFAWAPDSAALAFTMTEPVSAAQKERTQKYGDLTIEDQDHRMAHLHLLTLATREIRQLTMGGFVVGSFAWSPDGTRLAFDHRTNTDPASGHTADITVLDVTSGRRDLVVSQAGPDSNPRWSPDGRALAFQTAMSKPFFYFQNSELAVVSLDTREIRVLTGAFDENPSLLEWTPAGIFFSASQRTWAYLFKVDPATRAITRHAAEEAWIGTSFSLTPDGAHTAFLASGPARFPDVYTARITPTLAPTRVSDLGAQVAAWPAHAREVVRWKSQDGAEIEGVLHKPASFEAGRRYPLLIVIHGGPTGISRPVPYGSGSVYPIDLWLSEGALVLEPNYRGSAGYGEAFRSLNVRNLGIGDAWDVLSGIDHLVDAGLVDGSRVGTMGWSQGGYISAFLTTRHSDRFKAVSVGAGISNWMTYYVNTDIHPFTRQYLKATPWDDPQIYADTSPMTYIKQASAPTLIQHGDRDQRVPAPNAFELYQGLVDQGVPAQLVLFRGFGHGLDRPKANRGAMQQNFDWFKQHLWPGGGTTPQ